MTILSWQNQVVTSQKAIVETLKIKMEDLDAKCSKIETLGSETISFPDAKEGSVSSNCRINISS